MTTNTTNNKVTFITRNDDGTINKGRTAAKIAAYAVFGIGCALGAQSAIQHVQNTNNRLIEAEISRLSDKADEEVLMAASAASEDEHFDHMHNKEELQRDVRYMRRTLFGSNFIAGMAIGASTIIAVNAAACVMKFIDKK